jgi:hypothetical protein
MLPVVRYVPASALVPSRGDAAAATTPYRFLDTHQAATIVEATARLVPGPQDDPLEAGHPGAREAGVVRFIDRLLSAFDESPPAIFAGAPWSDRHTSGPDHMKKFLPLIERQEKAWHKRIKQLRKQVADAVVALDKGAVADGYKDFVSAPSSEQDKLLTDLADVRDVFFSLTIDAMYSVPEYGGNHQLVGWHEIGWPGDIQPVGYARAQVESDDGLDPVGVNELPAVQELVDALPILTRARAARTSVVPSAQGTARG